MASKPLGMEYSNDWPTRLRKQLEANLHRPSSEVTERQWQFDPALVDVKVDGNSAFVSVTRLYERDRPELTGPHFGRRFSMADDVEAAAREVGRFIQTLR